MRETHNAFTWIIQCAYFLSSSTYLTTFIIFIMHILRHGACGLNEALFEAQLESVMTCHSLTPHNTP
jgi:hypothetical protein